MHGLMMDQPLLLKSIAEFAERVSPDVEIVSFFSSCMFYIILK